MYKGRTLSNGLIAGICMLSAVPAVYGQATQSAKDKALDTVTVKVWTCSSHEQFRMTEKGTCPLCERDLTSKRIKIQGGDEPGDLYPLGTCPVSGRQLGEMGAPVVMMHQGREVRFCCAGCISKFEADASSYLEKMDKQIIEQQLPHYPMTTCPVSGEALGSMGEPVDYVHNNRLVRFCCKGCVRGFKKDPAAYLKTLDDAVLAQQKQAYPVGTCMVSGEKLGSMGKPVDVVVANRLVRFCCKGCVGAFFKDPAGHLAMVGKAWAKSGGSKAHEDKPGDRHGHGDHGNDHDHDH